VACAQPTSSKTARPFEVDGVDAAGVGGASIRVKLVNPSTSEIPRAGCRGGEVDRVLRRRIEETARRLVALLGEQLVRNTRLDVVGLTSEHPQRLVLRLPAEARDRPSLPLRFTLPLRIEFGWPEIPIASFSGRFRVMLARIAESGIASISRYRRSASGSGK